MDQDEDPMAYLNAKRQEMAAVGQMAAVAQAQADLARDVQRRMQKIEGLLQSDGEESKASASDAAYSSSSSSSAGQGDDPEVEYWKRKIEELSMPVTPRDGLAPAFPSAHSTTSSSPTTHTDSRLAEAKSHAPHYPGMLRPSVGMKSPGGDDAKSSERKASSSPAEAKPSSTRGAVAPSAKLSEAFDGDAEVEYWRRKIAQLSLPSNSGHEVDLPSSLGKDPRRAPPPRSKRSLADEPLSWEGTQSFADQNGPQAPKCESKAAFDSPGRYTQEKK